MAGFAEASDEDLMVAYQQGSLPAFELLFQRHSGRVQSFLRKRLGDSAAEEVFQASFLKLHQTRARYQRQHPFLAWLFVICKSASADHVRRRNTRQQAMEALASQPSVQPEPLGDQAEEWDLAHPRYRGLSEPELELLVRRYRDEASFEEIAQQQGLSAAAIRQRVSRTLRKLRALGGKA